MALQAFLSISLLFWSAVTLAANNCALPFFPQATSPLELMLQRVGTGPNFSGPNCYNTALLATGALPSGELRYIHSGEFEEILRTQYRPVPRSKAERGDLVVFHASGIRDHAAIYLGDGTVLHKKDVSKRYLYRIVNLSDVFKKEPGDIDNPFDGGGYRESNEDASKDVTFYRRTNPSDVGTELPSPAEASFITLVDFYSALVLSAAPNWAIHKRLGMITENILPEVLRATEQFRTSGSPAARLAHQRLESLSHQVFASIEETSFSSRYSSARAEEIARSIYLPEGDAMKSQLLELARFMSVSLSEQRMSEIIAVLERDRPVRRASVLALLRL